MVSGIAAHAPGARPTRAAHVLVTGGTGFVLAAATRCLLERDPAARVTSIDRVAPSPLVLDHLADVRDRVRFVQADVAEADALPALDDVTHVVHGAAVTLGAALEPAHPRAFVDVNIGGTLHVLEWVRRQRPARLLHVSSGAVYGAASRFSSEGPQDEDGPLDAPELYAISKLAAEQLVRRYGEELYDLDACAIRPSGVFGPMERPTPSRGGMSLPYRAVRAALEGRPLRVSPRTLDGALDLVSSEDVAEAIRALLGAERLAHPAYNVAAGVLTPVRDVLGLLREHLPGVAWIVDADAHEVDVDPQARRARMNAYAIERIRRDAGWAPRPIGERLGAYVRWVLEAPEERCPALGEGT